MLEVQTKMQGTDVILVFITALRDLACPWQWTWSLCVFEGVSGKD